MDMERINRAAALLAAARESGTLLGCLPADAAPAGVAEAHAIQDAVTARLGRPIGAFKAAAPPGGEPMRGVIYAGTIHRSPAHVHAAEVPQFGVEGEVAFLFERDLPCRDAPYSRKEVATSVAACAVIETVSSRYSTGGAATDLDKLADCISNAGLVHGPPLGDWRLLELGKIGVKLSVNGKTILEQAGGHPTGDPLEAAVALVNMMRETSGVRAGQFVTCGSYTGLRYLHSGDICTVQFEKLGAAEVRFIA
jgi:2-keto-4-pentenoate hydratase